VLVRRGSDSLLANSLKGWIKEEPYREVRFKAQGERLKAERIFESGALSLIS
jgi:hypothetical protein